MIVHQEPLAETLNRLRRYMTRMERRYERSSAEMERAFHSGQERETAEISKWMMKYQVLQRLEKEANEDGRTTGTHTMTI